MTNGKEICSKYIAFEKFQSINKKLIIIIINNVKHYSLHSQWLLQLCRSSLRCIYICSDQFGCGIYLFVFIIYFYNKIHKKENKDSGYIKIKQVDV